MKAAEEIRFWRKARKIIRQGYGKPCRDFNLDCQACRANLVISWIDGHIDLLKWSSKREPSKTKRI